jgi:hypothetical protein
MLLVDIFVLRDYFSGRSYGIFRAPLPCDSGDGWCTETGPASPDARYFYGVNADAFSGDPSRCKSGAWVPALAICMRLSVSMPRTSFDVPIQSAGTTFGADSALLGAQRHCHRAFCEIPFLKFNQPSNSLCEQTTTTTVLGTAGEDTSGSPGSAG